MKDLLMENNWQIQAKRHSIQNINEESCGLVFQKDDILYYLGAKNIAENRKNNFAIDPYAYLHAATTGKVIACFHSHIKNTSFSWSDINNSFKLNLPYYLYNIKQDSMSYFSPSECKNYKKYLYLKFDYGKNDCFSLIRNFYKNELDIEMSDPAQDRATKYIPPENCLVWSREKYKEWANENSLVDMDANNISQLKKYDILVFDGFNKGEPSHGMIYIGNELVLHHPFNDISKIESIRKAHFKFLKFIIRHEKF